MDRIEGSVAAMPRGTASGTWGDGFLRLRNRLLSSPAFQRAAARFLPTRFIARRRARELFDLVAGFVYSQVLLACVQLRLLEALAGGPRSVADLAETLAVPHDGMQRLLWAAASLRLVERCSDDRFGLGVHGAAMLGNPGIAAMVEHHGLLYADLADPVALLRGRRDRTALGAHWPYAMGGDPRNLSSEQVSAYTTLMAASQPLVAAEILDAYPFHRHRCVLDAGGGDGSFLLSVASRIPTLRLMLIDLPPVADRARVRLRTAGLSERMSVTAGDFLSDAWPDGADLVTLVRVVHDHDDPAVLELFRRAHRALPPGGTLLIAEPMANTPGAEPMGDAYFGFYLLAMGSGRARTPDELGALLDEAGFDVPHLLPTRMPLQTRVLVARRL
jgi:demethylspheroidene O-methyltransferase